MSVDFFRDGSVVSCPSVITGFTAPFPNRGQARVLGSGALDDGDYRLTAGDAFRSGDVTWKRLLGDCDFWFAIVPDHRDSGGAVAYRLEDLESFGLVPAEVASRLRSGQEDGAAREYRRRVQADNRRRADASDAAFRAAHPTGFVEIAAGEARALGRKVIDLLGEAKDAVVPGAPTLLVVGLVALAFVAVSRR